jgi:hypothetical protein
VRRFNGIYHYPHNIIFFHLSIMNRPSSKAPQTVAGVSTLSYVLMNCEDDEEKFWRGKRTGQMPGSKM